MGAVPSTPLSSSAARPQDTAEYLIGTFIGEKSFPLASDYWEKLLELPLNLQWPIERVHQACEVFALNNSNTRHLAKLLIHLSWCLQECASAISVPPSAYMKAVNATYFSSIFLKYSIENSRKDTFEELYLSLNENEAVPNSFSRGFLGILNDLLVHNHRHSAMVPRREFNGDGVHLSDDTFMKLDKSIEDLVVQSVLSFLGKVDISSSTYLLHRELLNFILAAMSTQLRSGPSRGPKDVNAFIDVAMIQESSLVRLVVSRLLTNYITRPHFALSSAHYDIFSEGDQPGVIQRVGTAAASFVLLPFSYFVSSSSEDVRSPLADISIHVLLILIHYRKCVLVDALKDRSDAHAALDCMQKENTYFSENPYCRALENARDIEFDRVDKEGNANSGPLVRLPFASLFDTLGMYLSDETAVLVLYSMIHGNSNFLEYVLVRTDIDTLLMPMLETLYNASKHTSNQIYMVLIILLILSQDSSFNASIHKLMLQSVPWYQERRLHQTSLGSLMVIILIRTVKYNLSKLRDVYLHTNCLATLANMAPHVHRLSAYASQRLVSLFDMLARKYMKLAELKNEKVHIENGDYTTGDGLPEGMSTELHIYTDFLRIVLETLNSILTYALPRNPEVVYAIMHRQEVFQPFKNHPRFDELLENVFTVLDFFNSRMDAQKKNGEWSVEKVLQVIVINCRSWRGEGMKMFTQLRFTYEQESHPEEFFIPYIWQLVISCCGFSFDPTCIKLFTVDMPLAVNSTREEVMKDVNDELSGNSSVHVGQLLV